MASRTHDRQPLETAFLAAESRAGASLSIFGMAIMAVVLLFIRLTFGPLVEPAWLLDIWLVGMISIIAVWATAMAVYTRRRPDDAEVVGYWVRLGAWLQTALNIGIAISPWILLPNAEPALRSLTIILYIWYVSTEIMTSSAAVTMPAWEILMLTGSTAGFVLWSAPPYAMAQVVIIAMIGATMIGLRHLVRRSAQAAIKARVASEQAEAATRAALATVAAERDAKTRFIASASHDLQQPLHAASLFFEQVAAHVPQDHAVAGVRSALASTQALIGQMLDHLRLEAGAMPVRSRALDLAPLIAAVAAEQGPASRAAGMRIAAVPGRHAVVADPVLLRRALNNLVANAVRHARGERILVGARRAGGIVTLWVIDDGNGIGDAEPERLFDDYAQGQGIAPGGFGLGLASVRRSLALMGGSAGLDPRWRGGCAFYLRLPAAIPEALCRAA